MAHARDLVGLIPAAGRGSRVAPLGGSKELYPVALRQSSDGVRPQVVSQFAMDRLARAGVLQTYVVLRDGKWDIAGYFGDGVELTGMHLAYVVATIQHGPAFSLDAAYPFVRDSIVALEFPDLYVWPQNMTSRLAAHQGSTGADVVLGLIPWDDPMAEETMAVDGTGRVIAFTPAGTDAGMRLTWVAAVWSPAYTEFLHDHLATELASGSAVRREVHLGIPLAAAFQAGLDIHGVVCDGGGFLDFGRPATLEQLYRGTITAPGFSPLIDPSSHG